MSTPATIINEQLSKLSFGSFFSGNLIIRNVTQEDTGTYLCKVNSGNEEQTVKDVYLKLIGKY